MATQCIKCLITFGSEHIGSQHDGREGGKRWRLVQASDEGDLLVAVRGDTSVVSDSWAPSEAQAIANNLQTLVVLADRADIEVSNKNGPEDFAGEPNFLCR